MKCPICNKGQLKKGKVDFSQAGIYFGKYKAEICTYCGESFFDEETSIAMETKSKKLGLFGIEKRAKIGVSGNSLTIKIPKEIAKFFHLRKGQTVSIRPYSKDKIEIEKISKGRI